MGHAITKKSVEEYKEKYSHIPKDYMERLAWLYHEYPYKRKDLDELLDKVDQLETTEWDTVTYIFYMEPKTSPRPRLNPNTFTFYVSGAHDNKKLFDDFKECHSDLNYVISTPSILTTKVYTRTPSNMSMQEKMAAELELIHNLASPDWDNIGKAYCDMVQETLIANDSIVCRGAVEKFYSCLPRVEVTLSYMMKYDCKFNKRMIERRKSFYENPKTKDDIDYII